MAPIRVMVPSEVADEMVADGDAVRPFATRSPAMEEILHFAIEGTTAAAAIVTLVEAEASKKLAKLLVARAGNSNINVTGPVEQTLNPDPPGETPAASLEAPASDDVDESSASKSRENEIVHLITRAQAGEH
jgi:hypothetical protein